MRLRSTVVRTPAKGDDWRKRVAFSLRGAGGEVWLPLDEIVVLRAYTFDDTERLAREIQEQRLLVEMQTDAVAQMVRRLQAARKP